MSEQEKRQFNASISVGGDVEGSIAAGDRNVQITTNRSDSNEMVAAWKELEAHFEGVRNQVAIQAPEDRRQAALAQVDELEEAVASDPPDIDRIESVKQWFAKNLPALAGLITATVAHPIVGKIVESAGNALAAEFQRRVNGD